MNACLFNNWLQSPQKKRENGNHVKDQLDDGADDHAHTQLKNFVEND
jgi:hypothetical protein